MPGPISIVVPLALAAVLIVSAIAKLRQPDDVEGWAALGVPAAFRRPWLVRLHPWGELVLGVALVVFGGVLGLLAALAAVVLMAAYLWLVARAVRRPDAECACFGAQTRVTGATVVRNAWLTALAVLAAATIWTNPLLGGAIAVPAADVWMWIAGATIAAITAVVVMWSGGGAAAAAEVEATATVPTRADGDEELDYIRTRTPAVPVTLADGTEVNLRRLASQKPILLLALSDICGSCIPVRESIPAWRALLPEVDIRVLLTSAPDDSRGWTEYTEPQSLHDPKGYVRGSIEDWGTPTAVLLGIDGLLAGGPVSGTNEVAQFVSDVYESLHGVPAPPVPPAPAEVSG